MPWLARKVAVCAAPDGLLIVPQASKKEQRVTAAVKIGYGDSSVTAVSRDAAPDLARPNFEAFGIVGALPLPFLETLAAPGPNNAR